MVTRMPEPILRFAQDDYLQLSHVSPPLDRRAHGSARECRPPRAAGGAVAARQRVRRRGAPGDGSGSPRCADRPAAHDRRGAHLPSGSDRQLPGGRVSGVAVLHLDESCLGNGREGENPGGGGGLVEARSAGGRIQRRDFYISSPATTNNRMALGGAIAALQLLAKKGARLQVLIVSDSQYLVKGMREWVPVWAARGWRRKEGAIENLELWKALLASSRLHDVQWTWVRGHKGHAKNEYANDLAVLAAKEQRTSDGIVESGFGDWLESKRARGTYLEYDPDIAFTVLEERLASGRAFALAEER